MTPIIGLIGYYKLIRVNQLCLCLNVFKKYNYEIFLNSNHNFINYPCCFGIQRIWTQLM
jgi:hypothetical protein